MTGASRATAKPIQPGQVIERVLTDDLTRTQIVQYAGASGDFNPVHTDEVFARDVAGYPGVFAHGMLTMGMLGQVVRELVGMESLKSFGGRFMTQVWPGDRLTARISVREVLDESAGMSLDADVINQAGVVVFKGQANTRW